MSLGTEAVQLTRDSESKRPEHAPTRESPAADNSSPLLGGLLSSIGTSGSNGSNSQLMTSSLMRHPASGEIRALVMRRYQQHVGNQRAQRLVAGGRAERQDLLIIARARDAVHAAQLYKSGASDAVPETVEASLQLSEAVLVDIGIAMGPAIASIHEKRSELQAEIKAIVPGTEVRSLGRRRLRDALQQRG